VSRWESWSFHILTGLVSVTGIVFFIMKYMMATEDPFALINHPLQPAMLDIHILAAPFLILVLGIMYSSHITEKLGTRNKANRRSGIAMLLSFLPMILSGYLLQVSTSALLSKLTLAVHVVSGLAFVGTYAFHQWKSVRLWRAQNRRSRVTRLAA
jgi:hypothetical protein